MQKVLMVEQNSEVVHLFRDAINEVFEDTEVIVYDKFQRVMEHAITNIPNIILLSAGLCENKSLEVCEALKSDSRTFFIPVIIITGRDHSQEFWGKAIKVNANGFLYNNVEKWECFAQLKIILNNSNPKQFDEKNKTDYDLINQGHRISFFPSNSSLPNDLLVECLKQFKETQLIGKIGSWKFELSSGKIAISDEFCKIYGLILGRQYLIKEIQKIPLPKYQTMLDEALTNLIEGRADYDLTFQIKRPSDRMIIDVHSVARYNNLENSVTGIIQDVTHWKRSEEVLRKSEEKFRNYIQGSPVPVYLVDNKGVCIMANWAACELLGYDEKELLQLNVSNILFADENSVGSDGFKHLKKVNNIENFETCLKRKDGRIVDVVIDGKRISDNEFIAFVKDITDRKRMEKQLKLLSRSVEQSPVSIVITDEKGNIEYVNPTYSKVSGFSFEETVGGKPGLLKSGYHSKDTYTQLWETISGGKEWRGELLNKRKDGALFWEDVSISPIFDERGNIAHYVAVKEDITGKKKMVEELWVAKEKAEESDRLKSAFLANMSHEIRTPMNGILGFADLLKESQISDEQKKEYISIIEESGSRMLNTINDLIDISKIESGVVDIEYSEVFIESQMDYLYQFFKPEVEKKGLQLLYSGGEHNHDSIMITDKLKLSAILTNLIKNAIKYTFQGTIEFGYSLDREKIVFYIKDSGIGIDEDRRQAIFDRFVQAEMCISRPYEGAGLGLSISKAYVDMLGGDIWVESEKGKGSVFYFSLPHNNNDIKTAIVGDGSIEGIQMDELLKDLSVLVADDDDVARMFLAAIFEKKCKKLFFVSNGKDAVTLFAGNPTIDLVLMDIKMPEMDGYTASFKMKQINKNVVILAQTAFALAGDREKAISSGCDDYIPKPLNRKVLFKMINKYFR